MLELIRNWSAFGTSPALIKGNVVLSYLELLQAVENRSADWHKVLESGNTVLLPTRYSFDSIINFFSVAACNGIIVPANPHSEAETAIRVGTVPPTWMIDSSNQLVASQLPTLSHKILDSLTKIKHPGVVIFSSGSTGAPKAIVHDLLRLYPSEPAQKAKRLRMIPSLLFDHIGGINSVFSALSTGCSLILPDDRGPEHICHLIEQHSVHILPTSPSFLNLLLISKCHERFNLSSIRLITYGTEPMPPPLLKRLRDSFPKTKFVQTFGTSETGIAKTSSPDPSDTSFSINDSSIEWKVVEGELWIKSESMALGYLNADETTFTDSGWFKTGDCAEVLEDGTIRIVGRKRDLINVGGEKVLPAEVENILLELPFVSDALVYAEKHSFMGSIVCASIVLNKNQAPPDFLTQIKSHCSQRLERYKVPAKIRLVDGLEVSNRFKKVRQ